MKQLIAASKTWRGVSWSILGGKILSLEPKNTLKEFKMLWNKHHEDSTDGKEGDNDLESIRPRSYVAFLPCRMQFKQ